MRWMHCKIVSVQEEFIALLFTMRRLSSGLLSLRTLGYETNARILQMCRASRFALTGIGIHERTTKTQHPLCIVLDEFSSFISDWNKVNFCRVRHATGWIHAHTRMDQRATLYPFKSINRFSCSFRLTEYRPFWACSRSRSIASAIYQFRWISIRSACLRDVFRSDFNWKKKKKNTQTNVCQVRCG